MADLPVIVLGAGGHAKVVINALLESGYRVLGITDPDPKTHGEIKLGVTVLGGDDHITEHPADTVRLVNSRRAIWSRCTSSGPSAKSRHGATCSRPLRKGGTNSRR